MRGSRVRSRRCGRRVTGAADLRKVDGPATLAGAVHRRRFLATLAATPIAAAVALRAAPAAAVAADSPDIAGLGYFVNDGTNAPTYQGIPRDVWAMQAQVNFLECHRLDGIIGAGIFS